MDLLLSKTFCRSATISRVEMEMAMLIVKPTAIRMMMNRNVPLMFPTVSFLSGIVSPVDIGRATVTRNNPITADAILVRTLSNLHLGGSIPTEWAHHYSFASMHASKSFG